MVIGQVCLVWTPPIPMENGGFACACAIRLHRFRNSDGDIFCGQTEYLEYILTFQSDEALHECFMTCGITMRRIADVLFVMAFISESACGVAISVTPQKLQYRTVIAFYFL